MLQCLDRPQRIAYILGDVFGLPSATAAVICETTHVTRAVTHAVTTGAPTLLEHG
ncbi:MAG: hypothetical protein ACRD07_22490 [Acidimicrobiales bacterium]